MKNEKTMLALVLVAALAMVSVAGVALASESSDADSGDTTTAIVGDQPVTINTSSGDYRYYMKSTLLSDATVTLTISDTANYTGLIQFGTMFSGKYVVLNSVSFENACGMVVTIAVDDTTHVATVSVVANDKVEGTATVSEGELSFTNFNGDLIVAGTTFSFDNVAGTVKVSAVDGVATISSTGLTVKTVPTGWGFADDGYVASVTVNGDANMGNFVLGTSTSGDNQYVKLIITEGSDVTLPMGYSYNPSTSTNTVVMPLTGVASGKATGVLVDKYGIIVGTATASNDNQVTIALTVDMVNSNENYTLVMLYQTTDIIAEQHYSYGTVSFIATAIAGTYDATYSNASGIVSAFDKSLFASATSSLDITVSGYEFVGALSLSNGCTFTISNSNANTVTAVIADEGAKDTFFILKNDITGALSYYYGSIVFTTSGVTSIGDNTILTKENAFTKGTATIGGAEVSKLNTLTINADAYLDLYGTIDAKYEADAANLSASILNYGTIDVNGKITVQKDKVTEGMINSARYPSYIGNTTNYYNIYTTLKNALSASNDITVLGTITVLEDITLAGADTTKNTKFTVAGTLNIGDDDNVAIVTVPSKGTTITTTFKVDGSVVVDNGQLVLTGETTDRDIEVIADVFISTAGTYTDLATAVSLVSSGTIKLRQNVDVEKSITIIDGVTLDANTYTVTVSAGGALIIDGAFSSDTTVTVNKADTAKAKAAGILTFNTKNVKYVSLTVNGVLNIGADAELTLGTIAQTEGTSPAPVIINVYGDLKITDSIGASGKYTTLNVAGTLDLASTASLPGAATTTVTVSGTMNASCAASLLKLTVSGTFNMTAGGTIAEAIVTGTFNASKTTATVTEMTVTDGKVVADKITLAIPTLTVTGASEVSAVVDVNGNGKITSTKLTVGKAPTTFGSFTNSAKVHVYLTGGEATVYGSFSAEDIVIWTTTNVDAISTAYYLQANGAGNNVLYATVFAFTSDCVDISDLSISAMTGYKTFNGTWYNENGDEVITTGTTTKVGTSTFEKVYSVIEGKDVTITFGYNPGVTYLVNNASVPLDVVTLVYGMEYKLAITVNNGYTGTPVIDVEGISFNASTGMFYITDANGDALVTVTGVEVKEDPVVEKDNLVTILLIIITIVIVIMAIIIALKLMRS